MALSRRGFIKAGVAGVALLATAHLLNRHWGATEHAPAGALDLKVLDARSAQLIAALAPVILADALPDEATSRQIAINEVVDAFDRALARLSPAVKDELAQLLTLLTFAPTRIMVAGVWQPWHEASPEAISAFLTSWRESRFGLLTSGYQALRQLLQAAWYGNPLAWGKIGFVLPLRASELE